MLKKKVGLSNFMCFLSILCFLIFILHTFFVQKIEGGQVGARWIEASESDLKEYLIERKGKKRGSWAVIQRPARGTSQTMLVGVDGKAYWWRIRAVDFSGNIGGPSNVVYHKFPRKKKPGRQGLNYGEVVVFVAGG